jgi:hypothetical protein
MVSMGKQQEVISEPGVQVMERIKTPVGGVNNDSISIYRQTVVPIQVEDKLISPKPLRSQEHPLAEHPPHCGSCHPRSTQHL